jgi:hypothetical protein
MIIALPSRSKVHGVAFFCSTIYATINPRILRLSACVDAGLKGSVQKAPTWHDPSTFQLGARSGLAPVPPAREPGIMRREAFLDDVGIDVEVEIFS